MSKATRPAEERRAKQVDGTGSSEINARITARIVVDANGETQREYVIGGRSFGSIEAAIRLYGGEY